MNKIKELFNRFFVLKPIYVFLISIPSFILVIFALVCLDKNSPVSYIAYVLSAYALVLVSVPVYNTIKTVKSKTQNNKFYKIYSSDISVRIKVSLYPGLAISFVYIVINFVSGCLYGSFWFVSLAAYYVLIWSMNFYLLSTVRKDTIGQNIMAELRKSRFCGIWLIFTDVVLIGIVTFMVGHGRMYNYPGILIYVMAAYSFYSIISSIVHLVRYRRYKSPVLMSINILDSIAALVSILSLETAMLSEFGTNEGPFFNKLMISLTGAGIFSIIMCFAILMIIKSKKTIKSEDK